jgi:internalin A
MLLGLGSNQLTALPATIGQLTALKYLYIDDNPLTTLPDTIGQLVNLRQLYLHGNPHLGIPDEVLGPRWQEVGEDIRPADPHKILDYYFRTRQGERPLNEGRLILVGRGGAGKTSLVKRLVLDEFDPDEKQTDGINITQWPIDCPAGDKIRLHLWDFGGQEILHALHRFFLSERALYLLVVTGREGAADGDVEYWMQHIDTFGPSSPVIVVLNKCASCPVELERRRLQAKYPQIRAFVETDCDTRAGLDTLKTEITAAIDGMEEVRKKFPAGWFGIKDTLSGMAEPYISLKRYQEICAENNETEPQAQEDLAYFLHCLGIALHFPEEQLRETSVLSPHWVTGGVYGILTAEAIRRNGGLTDARALGGILPESYGGKQAFLLELMRKFQLCLPFGDGHRFLIPELLPKDEPADLPVFPVEEGLGFAYHYALLPEGVLPEFIVRSYVLSEGGQRWRNGVVLAWEGCRALVRADIFDGRVSIRIIDGDAEARRRLLGVIRADFETIHQGLKLKPAAFVPVPGHPAATPISYDDLCAFEQSRVETYHHNIDGKVIPLTVADLLNGVDPSPAGRLIGDPARSSLPRVFISYAHKDERLRAELDPHLKWLKRQGIIDYWYDRMIHPGERWDDRIKRELDSAQIVLFFVSTDFLASDYIYEQEIPLALARQEAGKAIGISVILRAVHNFKNCPLAPFQAVNDPERPIKSMSSAERDKAWVQVEAAIQTAAARTGR